MTKKEAKDLFYEYDLWPWYARQMERETGKLLNCSIYTEETMDAMFINRFHTEVKDMTKAEWEGRGENE